MDLEKQEYERVLEFCRVQGIDMFKILDEIQEHVGCYSQGDYRVRLHKRYGNWDAEITQRTQCCGCYRCLETLKGYTTRGYALDAAVLFINQDNES